MVRDRTLCGEGISPQAAFSGGDAHVAAWTPSFACPSPRTASPSLTSRAGPGAAWSLVHQPLWCEPCSPTPVSAAVASPSLQARRIRAAAPATVRSLSAAASTSRPRTPALSRAVGLHTNRSPRRLQPQRRRRHCARPTLGRLSRLCRLLLAQLLPGAAASEPARAALLPWQLGRPRAALLPWKFGLCRRCFSLRARRSFRARRSLVLRLRLLASLLLLLVSVLPSGFLLFFLFLLFFFFSFLSCGGMPWSSA